jgi:hypothetical protein
MEDAAAFPALPQYDGASVLHRAERIARTESMLAYNEASLASYAEYDVEMVEAMDGDEDEECRIRNGQTFTIAEAAGIEDHPNGTLGWAPIVGPAKAAPPEPQTLRIDVGERPDVHVEAPVVNVAAPVVHLDANPFVKAIHDLEAVMRTPRKVRKTIHRNEAGIITSVTEEEYDG